MKSKKIEARLKRQQEKTRRWALRLDSDRWGITFPKYPLNLERILDHQLNLELLRRGTCMDLLFY